jgi:hypothetical protein
VVCVQCDVGVPDEGGAPLGSNAKPSEAGGKKVARSKQELAGPNWPNGDARTQRRTQGCRCFSAGTANRRTGARNARPGWAAHSCLLSHLSRAVSRRCFITWGAGWIGCVCVRDRARLPRHHQGRSWRCIRPLRRRPRGAAPVERALRRAHGCFRMQAQLR